MKHLATFALTVCLATAAFTPAFAEPNRVTFPPIDQLEHYTTVTRGEVTEHMLMTPEALAAVRAGQRIPNGTHVVLVDYRGGEVLRYFVMEKGEGCGHILGRGHLPPPDAVNGRQKH